MDVEGRLETVSRVSPSPVKKGMEQQKNDILPNINDTIDFQLNPLGGPLDEDFTKE